MGAWIGAATTEISLSLYNMTEVPLLQTWQCTGALIVKPVIARESLLSYVFRALFVNSQPPTRDVLLQAVQSSRDQSLGCLF